MQNLLEIQDALRSAPDQQLMGLMQNANASVPQWAVASELNNRKEMRDEQTRQEGLGQPTIVDQLTGTGQAPTQQTNAAGVPQGIASGMAQSMAPQTDVAQNTGIKTVAPNTAAPVATMASGGILKMAPGGFPRGAANQVIVTFVENSPIYPGETRRMTQDTLEAMPRNSVQDVFIVGEGNVEAAKKVPYVPMSGGLKRQLKDISDNAFPLIDTSDKNNVAPSNYGVSAYLPPVNGAMYSSPTGGMGGNTDSSLLGLPAGEFSQVPVSPISASGGLATLGAAGDADVRDEIPVVSTDNPPRYLSEDEKLAQRKREEIAETQALIMPQSGGGPDAAARIIASSEAARRATAESDSTSQGGETPPPDNSGVFNSLEKDFAEQRLASQRINTPIPFNATSDSAAAETQALIMSQSGGGPDAAARIIASSEAARRALPFDYNSPKARERYSAAAETQGDAEFEVYNDPDPVAEFAIKYAQDNGLELELNDAQRGRFRGVGASGGDKWYDAVEAKYPGLLRTDDGKWKLDAVFAFEAQVAAAMQGYDRNSITGAAPYMKSPEGFARRGLIADVQAKPTELSPPPDNSGVFNSLDKDFAEQRLASQRINTPIPPDTVSTLTNEELRLEKLINELYPHGLDSDTAKPVTPKFPSPTTGNDALDRRQGLGRYSNPYRNPILDDIMGNYNTAQLAENEVFQNATPYQDILDAIMGRSAVNSLDTDGPFIPNEDTRIKRMKVLAERISSGELTGNALISAQKILQRLQDAVDRTGGEEKFETHLGKIPAAVRPYVVDAAGFIVDPLESGYGLGSITGAALGPDAEGWMLDNLALAQTNTADAGAPAPISANEIEANSIINALEIGERQKLAGSGEHVQGSMGSTITNKLGEINSVPGNLLNPELRAKLYSQLDDKAKVASDAAINRASAFVDPIELAKGIATINAPLTSKDEYAAGKAAGTYFHHDNANGIPEVPKQPAGDEYASTMKNILAQQSATKDQDKWLALAEMGMRLMASTNPNILSAVGESALGATATYKKDQAVKRAQELRTSERAEDRASREGIARLGRESREAIAAGKPPRGPASSVLTSLDKDVKLLEERRPPTPKPGSSSIDAQAYESWEKAYSAAIAKRDAYRGDSSLFTGVSGVSNDIPFNAK